MYQYFTRCNIKNEKPVFWSFVVLQGSFIIIMTNPTIKKFTMLLLHTIINRMYLELVLLGEHE